MFDTIRLYMKGQNHKDFTLKIDNFKKASNEFDDVERYYNNFKDSNGNNIYINYDLAMRQGVNITFSIPKIANNTQLNNFKLSDKDKLFTRLEGVLSGVIDIDYKNMKVSRLDITSNIFLEGKASYYINVIQSNFTKLRNYKTDFYQNESFTVYNKSRRFIVYDKVTEQLSKRVKLDAILKEKRNILRFEIQNNRARDVKALLNRDFNFIDIFNEVVFLDCISLQKKYFKQLFMNNKEQLNLFETDKLLIDILMKYYKKNLIQKFIIKKQLDNNDFSFQGIETLFQGLYTDRGLRKAIKELKELKFLSVTTDYSLLNEVYTKFDKLIELVA